MTNRHWLGMGAAAIAIGTLAAWIVVRPARAQDAPSIEQINELLQAEQWDRAIEASSLVLESDPGHPGARFALALATHSSGDHQAAIDLHRRAAESPRYRALALYNLACALALTDQKDEAIAALSEARRAGYGWLHEPDPERIDPDLESIRDDPRFRAPRPVEFVEFKDDAGTTCTYALLLPDDFDPKRPVPVLIAMGPGPENQGTAEWGIRAVWGEAAVARGWAVIATTRPVRKGWRSHEGVALMGALMNQIAKKVTPEDGKFHLAGCSNGGASAWVVALALPSRVHSLTVIPGNPPREVRLNGLKAVEVIMHVGSEDAPWLSANQRAKKQLDELGYGAELHVYDGVGHVIEAVQGGVLMDQLTARHQRIMNPDE